MKKKEKIEEKEQGFSLNNLDTRIAVSRVLFGLLAIFGLIFIIMGTVSLVQEIQIKDKYVKSTGFAISNIETEEGLYIATYSYSYNDESYTVQSDYAITKEAELGTEQVIYINPEDPNLAIVETFNENILLLVIGAMMLVIPLALYMIDPDSQKDDKNGLLKAGMVVVCGILFYLLAGALISNYWPQIIWKYSPLLVLMPIVFIAMGVYAIVKIFIFKKEAESKKNRLKRFFKIKKKK